MDETFGDGFQIVPGVLSSDECDGLLAAVARRSLKRSRAGARHLMSMPEVRTIASDPRLLSIARHWVGEAAIPYRATLFDKSAGANWLVVWHQDKALPLRSRFEAEGWGPWSVKDGVLYAHAPAGPLSRIVALRLHLDASRADNGPLRVLPGSQLRGVLSDDEIHAAVQGASTQECLLERGGVLAMRPLLLHSSGKATAADPRRVLHIEYARSRYVLPGLELAVA
jgi:ectoine hydroxylase-related dioxygenase (phytanoyl-CoA dioxygenase family)